MEPRTKYEPGVDVLTSVNLITELLGAHLRALGRGAQGSLAHPARLITVLDMLLPQFSVNVITEHMLPMHRIASKYEPLASHALTPRPFGPWEQSPGQPRAAPAHAHVTNATACNSIASVTFLTCRSRKHARPRVSMCTPPAPQRPCCASSRPHIDAG
jgi:hypothetical protein